ncbi:MAG: pyridoxamine 5'-phosphate oxidase family protein [Deltaproteobacteria bacterium]|nr:pyridoxamine 5'-phosphate oxidase family protein [Deltaproteobacteria bacterium]
MSLAMSRTERETFLAAVRVAVVSVAAPGRAPLCLPIWYSYEPGGAVRFATGGSSRKAALMRAAGRASLCVQTETPPYQYVSVEGPITIREPDFETDLRPLAYRYLGQEMGDWYLRTTASERADSVLVTLTPERWLSADYNKMVMA